MDALTESIMTSIRDLENNAISEDNLASIVLRSYNGLYPLIHELDQYSIDTVLAAFSIIDTRRAEQLNQSTERIIISISTAKPVPADIDYV